MISPAVVLLAVVLPSLLCFLLLLGLILLGGLLNRSRHHRASDAIDRQSLQAKCTELEERLASFPKAWDKHFHNSGFRTDQVEQSFGLWNADLFTYIEEVIDHRNPQDDSEARIKALLFGEPPFKHTLQADKDVRVFPNPHEYTPQEIYTFLQNTNTSGRSAIINHIMSVILLHAISLDGNPFQTLLPFEPEVVVGLGKLKTLIRGVNFSQTLSVYISKFGFYCALPAEDVADRMEPYHALFESLCGPYFKTKTPADVAQRRSRFQQILDLAVQHGMIALGLPEMGTEYRWEPRHDDRIMTVPALRNLTYEGETLKFDTKLSNSQSIGVKRD